MNKCWIWKRAKDTNGYGHFSVRKHHLWVHQVSYALFNGPLRQLHVLHHCDNRACYNPKHLYLGTHKDNMNDMKTRGRCAKPLAKLNYPIVRYIRAALKKGKTTLELAKIYGVDRSQIYRIKNGQTWKELQNL